MTHEDLSKQDSSLRYFLSKHLKYQSPCFYYDSRITNLASYVTYKSRDTTDVRYGPLNWVADACSHSKAIPCGFLVATFCCCLDHLMRQERSSKLFEHMRNSILNPYQEQVVEEQDPHKNVWVGGERKRSCCACVRVLFDVSNGFTNSLIKGLWKMLINGSAGSVC